MTPITVLSTPSDAVANAGIESTTPVQLAGKRFNLLLAAKTMKANICDVQVDLSEKDEDIPTTQAH